ncbi:hypothetical protein S83_059514, partial [Arachis hypogaea]
ALDSFDSFLQCTCVMKSSDKPPKGSNLGTLAAESPVVNNLFLPYLGFLKPMASSPHFDDAKSKAEEAASGVTTGMILSLRERLFEQRIRWRLGITDEDQCMLLLDFPIWILILIFFLWGDKTGLPQLKKLFLLNIRKKEAAARMYGDCQVMSTMGGNVVVNSSKTLFSSPIQNNSFTFMPTMHFHHSFPTM